MRKLFTLIVAALVSVAAFATEPGDGSKTTGIAVMKKSENTFSLVYMPAGVTNVKVYIYDANGKEIFSETVKKTDGFVRPYTFTQLEPGDYSVTVVDGEKSFTKKFSYGKTETKKLARVARIEDGRYLVAIPASFYQGVAEIRIYNDGEMAHKQSIQTTSDYAQVFNVENLRGEVTFEVTDSKGNKIN